MNEPARILAVRHGQTAWNAETRMQGQLDTALDDIGRWQAERLADALRDESIDLIVASDLQRTLQTAAPLARMKGIDVITERGLRERAFGVFEGHTYDDIHRRWPDDAARWRSRDIAFAPAGGESLQGFHARCVDTASRLCAQYPGRAMVWVTHGGVLDCLYRAATRVELNAPRTWGLANAAINRLLHGDQGLMLVGWGDVRHLDEQQSGAVAGKT